MNDTGPGQPSGHIGKRPRRAVPEEEQAARVVAGSLATWASWPDARDGLCVGVVCDTAQSMQSVTREMASLAWVLTVGAQLAGWPPGRDPAPVHTATILACTQTGVTRIPDTLSVSPRPIPPLPSGGTSLIEEGVRTAVPAACLASQRQAARLLVMITDAHSLDEEIISRTQVQLDALRESGCGVLWVCPALNGCDFGIFPEESVHVFSPGRHLVPAALAATAVDAMQRVSPLRERVVTVTDPTWI